MASARILFYDDVPSFSEIAFDLTGQKMFQIMEKALNLEETYDDIIHLEIGDPDFNSPDSAKGALIEAVNNNITHYAPSSGLKEFKEACQQRTYVSRGFKPNIDQILITSGANIQIYLACACLIDPGDEIIIQDPCFVSYSSIIKSLRGNPIPVKLHEANNFEISVEDISKKISHRTKAIILNSPHNPTGSVISKETFLSVFDLCRKHDIYLISDEVYGRMIFSDCPVEFYSPSRIDQCNERTILIHSFSKTYAMTGWRIGAVTGPSDLIKKMSLLHETITSCVPPFIQLAAAHVLEKDPLISKPMILEYEKRRDMFMEGIANLKHVSCVRPYGAFYAFANFTRLNQSSEYLSNDILESCHIATCPGSYFGNAGEGFVRFCFANSKENISEALRRLAMNNY